MSETIQIGSQTFVPAEELRQVRNAAIEEVAAFVETHWCENDMQNNYKVHERKPHPNEPLAKAIRGLKVQP